MQLTRTLPAFFFLILLCSPAWPECPSAPRDQLQQEHQNLLDSIQKYNELYEAGTPAITDEEYDALTLRQRELSRCLGLKPAYASPPPLDNLHRFPMGSLKKASAQQEIDGFLENARRLGSPVILQPKFDGIAVELVYRKGKLVQALTRGQWRERSGQDLLAAMPAIPDIPKTLSGTLHEIVIHGEIYTQPSNPYAEDASSPRHYVAGLLSQNQPAIKELARLQFFPWFWVNSPLGSLRANNQQLKNWGFSGAIKFSHTVKSLEEIINLRRQYEAQNAQGQRSLDGIVLKLDNLTVQKRLGHLDGTPYWALAWKFPAKTAVTRINDIHWSIGRTGQITVLLALTPTRLQGIDIAQVSGGVIKYFKTLDIAVGDTISIALKGAATPVLGKVIVRPDNRTLPQLPDPAHYNGLTCLKLSPKCREQFLSRLQWLSGRNGLDLPGVDQPLLEQLIDNGHIRQLADLFTVPDALLPSESLTILKRPDLSLAQTIRALGIPEVGRKRSEKLAKTAGTWRNIAKASSDTFQEWLKLSEGEAGMVIQYLQTPEIKAVAQKLIPTP